MLGSADVGETEAAMEALDLLPLHSEFLEVGFRPYVLDLATLGLGGGEGTTDLTIAVVVMMRQQGFLAALPELALSAEVLEPGMLAEPDALVGPSTRVEVRAAAMDEDTLQLAAAPGAGKLLTVLLVDFANRASYALRELSSEDLSLITPFDLPEDHLAPWPDDVVARALAWAGGAVDLEVSERIQFYSAEEVPETPPAPAPKRSTRRRTPGGGSGGGDQTAAAAKRRPTVAQLAESLEALTATLPGITSKLQELSERTSAMETERGVTSADRPSALRRPLGLSASIGSLPKSSPAQLVKEMPVPKSSSAATRAPRVSFAPDEVEEMALDLPQGSDPLAQAMLMQSKAITALVTPLAANSSPLQDLGSTASSLSSKGAAGRARLQTELASHRGVFFASVLQSMEKDAASDASGSRSISSARPRGDTYPVPREVWRFWKNKRPGLHHLAGCNGSQPHARGQPHGCKRRGSTLVRMPRTSCHGQWKPPGGLATVADRGSSRIHQLASSVRGQLRQGPTQGRLPPQPTRDGSQRPCSF